MSVATRIKAAMGTMDGIHVLGDPRAMVIAFGVDERPRPINVYSISDRMSKVIFLFMTADMFVVRTLLTS